MAFVSEATAAYLSVEFPPHARALQLHATSNRLALSNLFALLPGGRVMALGTNALLALCAPVAADEAQYAPPAIGEDGLAPKPAAESAGPLPRPPSDAPTVCTGRHARKGDPHYHLLRSLAGLTNTSAFEIQRV